MKLLFNIALILAVSVCLLIHAQGAHSADPTPEQVEFFRTKIGPVLKRECYKCHSQQAKKVQGEFLLDNRDSLRNLHLSLL